MKKKNQDMREGPVSEKPTEEDYHQNTAGSSPESREAHQSPP